MHKLNLNKSVLYYYWTNFYNTIPISILILMTIEYYAYYYTFEIPKVLANLDDKNMRIFDINTDTHGFKFLII